MRRAAKEACKRDSEPHLVDIVRRARRKVSHDPASEACNQRSMTSLLLSLGRDRGSLSPDVGLLTRNRACPSKSLYHVSRSPDSLCSCLGSMGWSRHHGKRARERLTGVTEPRASTKDLLAQVIIGGIGLLLLAVLPAREPGPARTETLHSARTSVQPDPAKALASREQTESCEELAASCHLEATRPSLRAPYRLRCHPRTVSVQRIRNEMRRPSVRIAGLPYASAASRDEREIIAWATPHLPPLSTHSSSLFKRHWRATTHSSASSVEAEWPSSISPET